MEAQEIEFDCESQPLEFALIVLDMITDGGIDASDTVMMDPEALNGGFGISLQFGENLDLTLTYDEKLKTFTGVASVAEDRVSPRLLKNALLLNGEMPSRRRFLITTSGALALQETWPIVDLEAATLAADLHRLIEFMNVLALPQEPQKSALNVSNGIRG